MRAWAQSITAALLVVLVATLATVTATGDTGEAREAATVRMVQGTLSPGTGADETKEPAAAAMDESQSPRTTALTTGCAS